MDRLISDLVTVSLKLGDACTNTIAVSNVIDLKEDWMTLKSQVQQQSAVLQEALRVQQKAGGADNHHGWQEQYEKRRTERDAVMCELQTKITNHEV